MQCPLVLVLDDLHWADQASLDFFRFLARQPAIQRISSSPSIAPMSCTVGTRSTPSCRC